jgi:2-methylcitrate dehydratase PrpD
VIALRRKVAVAPDAALKKIQSRITITLNDGRVLNKFVENALGTLARPMSDADLERKFRGLAGEVLATSAADALIALCWSAEQLADGGAIARATVPQAAK